MIFLHFLPLPTHSTLFKQAQLSSAHSEGYLVDTVEGGTGIYINKYINIIRKQITNRYTHHLIIFLNLIFSISLYLISTVLIVGVCETIFDDFMKFVAFGLDFSGTCSFCNGVFGCAVCIYRYGYLSILDNHFALILYSQFYSIFYSILEKIATMTRS